MLARQEGLVTTEGKPGIEDPNGTHEGLRRIELTRTWCEGGFAGKGGERDRIEENPPF